MTTDHHTPYPLGGPLTSPAMEAPLGQLDLAIGRVMATGSGGFATALTAQANAASTGPFSVGSTAGMLVNDVVFFGDAGGTQESRIVATVPGGGTTFTVTVALTNTYAIGKPVTKSPIEIVTARGAFGTLGARLTDVDADIAAEIARATAAEAAITAAQAFVGCKAYNNAVQSIATGVVTAANLNSEEFDSDGFHTTTSRLTVPTGKSGKYLCIGAAIFVDANNTGYRMLTLMKNGARTIRTDQKGFPNTVAGAGTALNISTILDLVATDYIELGVYQNSTISIDIGSVTTGDQTFLSLVKV